MQHYKEAFKDRPYFYNPMVCGPDGRSNPKRHRFKYVFVWRALTPTGRPSKYFHWKCTSEWSENPTVSLPRLKKGYRWTGPYLYGEYQTWDSEE